MRSQKAWRIDKTFNSSEAMRNLKVDENLKFRIYKKIRLDEKNQILTLRRKLKRSEAIKGSKVQNLFKTES